MATTYLDMVNDVLVRLRDTEVGTLSGAGSDTLLIGKLVNDAARKVADAHDWAAQEYIFDLTTVIGQQDYSLTNADNRAIIEDVYNITTKTSLRQRSRKWGRMQELQNTPDATPTDWWTNGVDSNGDAVLRLYPSPVAAESVKVYTHFKPNTNFSIDTDETELPMLPIVHLAWAYAARERGEVGGQTAGEIFQIAASSLSDAIAYDRGNNEFEDDWYTP